MATVKLSVKRVTFRAGVFLGLLTSLFVFALSGPAAAVMVEKIVSKKGIEAWLVRDNINPIVTMKFSVRGGAALDPRGKEGLANLVASTLDEGAGEIKSQAFQRQLEDLSISLSFSAGKDTFSGSVRTLNENRDVAFRLLRLAITQPRFDAEPVERVRSQIISGIRRGSENPRRIANRTLMETLFPDHPYGRTSRGTLESVPRIKNVDLKFFVKQRLARNNLVIGVVGDITPAQLSDILDDVFGGLPGEASSWKLPTTKAAPANRTIIVGKNIPQSIIRFGHGAVKRDDPDFYAAYVMNYILGGGGFESRLYAEVREKRGLAYSAYSYLYPFDQAGLILGGAGTANRRAAETVKIVRNEWQRMASKGVSPEELSGAKQYLTGSYALRFGSSRRIASMLVGLQLDNLGIDYFDKRNKLISAVTIEDVNRVAKRIVDPKNLTLVVVGNPEGLSPTP